MKPRTVLLTLEVKTDAPLSVLRNAASYSPTWMLREDYTLEVELAQANVVEPRGKAQCRVR